MKKQVLASLMLLCLSASGGTADSGFDMHDRRLLALHLGYAHPLSGTLLAPPLSPSATQVPLQ